MIGNRIYITDKDTVTSVTGSPPNVMFTSTISIVPEPASIILMGFGVLGMVGLWLVSSQAGRRLKGREEQGNRKPA